MPNATAYNETCGAIGNLMWNWRMLSIRPQARFADVMEQTLYGAVLSGVNTSGSGWSYTNPLRWHGAEHELLSNDYHQRFDPGDRRICCPTNLLRTIASWNGYLYSTSDEGLWVQHYGGSVVQTDLPDGREISLTQTTDYPWNGEVRFSIDRLEPGQPFSIRLRVPGWVKGASITVNGKPVPAKAEPSSYARIMRRWQTGDVVKLELPMPVRLMVADHRVEQTRGQVAVMRGPVVYCLESTDLPDGVSIEEVHLPRAAEWTVRHEPDLLRCLCSQNAVLCSLGRLAQHPWRNSHAGATSISTFTK